MELETISITRIITYTQCQAKYYFRYVAEEPAPLPPRVMVGGAFHYAVEENFKQKTATEEDLPLEQILEIFSDEFDHQASTMEWESPEEPYEYKDPAIDGLALYMTYVAPDIQPEDVEQLFEMSFSGCSWKFTGRVDVVDQDGRILDLKTTSKRVKKASSDNCLQIHAYNVGREAMGEEPAPGRLDYIVLGKNLGAISFSVVTRPTDKEFFKNLLAYVTNGIEMDSWIPNRNTYNVLCSRKSCEYWQACEAEYGGTVRD